MTAVIAQHCKILPVGWMGVWLFFVISGFVVTTSLMSGPAREGAAMVRPFYLRRGARILPIYLAYVIVGFAISGAATGHLQWRPFLSLVLFYNNFQAAFGVGTFKDFPVGHLWTISVEMQFYLFFGFAFALLTRRWLGMTLISFLLVAPMLRYVAGVWLMAYGMSPLKAAFAIYSFSIMHFDSFAAGALLALGIRRWRQARWAWGLFIVGVATMAVYAGVYVLINRAHGAVGAQIFRNVISGILIGNDREIWVYSAVASLSAGILALTVTGVAPWSFITRNGVLQAIGRASYGGYVYHASCVRALRPFVHAWAPPAVNLAGKLESGVFLFVLSWSATVFVSLLSYRVVERPIIAWMNRRLSA